MHDEAIMVQTMAPTEAHVAAFTAMWHVQTQPAGDGEPHIPPQQSPSQVRRHRAISMLSLEILMIVSFDSLLRISHKSTQHRLTVPPSNPPLNDWVCPLGSREPEEDDQEVTFPGGGRWGPERQTTPVLNSPAGGRVPSGPPQQSPCPALAGPDMGQLIPALTSGLCNLASPKISTFSGKVAPGKTKVSYEQWSHEVQCIKDHYLESVVRESIMWSLRGAAAGMACYVGPTAGVSEILEKLSVIFGTVASFDILM